MHSEENQTLSLRDVDRTAYDGVGAIVVDGCNSCSHNRARRQNAVAKMKDLGLYPISSHKKATTFNGTVRSTKNGMLKIPYPFLPKPASVFRNFTWYGTVTMGHTRALVTIRTVGDGVHQQQPAGI